MIYGKRAMLNKPGYHGTASIVAEIYQAEDTRWYGKLYISDCDRVIKMDIDGFTEDEGSYQNDLYKIDAMIDCLKELRKGMPKARREHLKAQARREKELKKDDC